MDDDRVEDVTVEKTAFGEVGKYVAKVEKSIKPRTTSTTDHLPPNTGAPQPHGFHLGDEECRRVMAGARGSETTLTGG